MIVYVSTYQSFDQKRKGLYIYWFVYILLAMLRMEVEEGGVVCQPQEA